MRLFRMNYYWVDLILPAPAAPPLGSYLPGSPQRWSAGTRAQTGGSARPAAGRERTLVTTCVVLWSQGLKCQKSTTVKITTGGAAQPAAGEWSERFLFNITMTEHKSDCYCTKQRLQFQYSTASLSFLSKTTTTDIMYSNNNFLCFR